jgi:hypothetical protein
LAACHSISLDLRPSRRRSRCCSHWLAASGIEAATVRFTDLRQIGRHIDRARMRQA